MSKYFGWLKKDKQENKPQQDAQTGQLNKPLSPIPQEETPIVHADSNDEIVSQAQSSADTFITPGPPEEQHTQNLWSLQKYL